MTIHKSDRRIFPALMIQAENQTVSTPGVNTGKLAAVTGSTGIVRITEEHCAGSIFDAGQIPFRNIRRVQVLLVKNEKEHAWAINSRNID